MILTTPIRPADKEPHLSSHLIDEVIQYLNQHLSHQNWHDQIAVQETEWNAIILSPYDKFTNVMDEVVKLFKQQGWNCRWASAYDARGPHECFYVHKEHYENKE